ncbi:hypothetical protein GUITHDRAFT_141199 [Guillardia theta CCMP2712]|uniref:Uncharacterized protein n=1 Tax=Guillardia theta (strain CCMP2712) TaxID=905079 RepID=L1J1X2_GUITC|nr:hypothetical protein GUITHDRAFT_141199 [Guillardia theta CCMP2712]EKX42533.1 hypothetical protein GUITHDRAFT_141199 [Guillardia theta CCMP2712]|eukprot:XP_005829513.1 hypothetical protein GUITHDRAFT_141199 [Guillardia theta CCMP2712]
MAGLSWNLLIPLVFLLCCHETHMTVGMDASSMATRMLFHGMHRMAARGDGRGSGQSTSSESSEGSSVDSREFCKEPKTWDLRTGQSRGWMAGHTNPPTDLSARKGVLFSCSSDDSVREWDVELRREVRQVKCNQGGVRCIVEHEDRIVSGGYDGTVKFWTSAHLTLVFKIELLAKPVRSACVWKDLLVILAAQEQSVSDSEFYPGPVRKAEETGVRCQGRGDVLLWDLSEMREHVVMNSTCNDAWSCTVIDGVLYVAGKDRSVKAFDVSSSLLLSEFTGNDAATSITSICSQSGEELLAMGFLDGRVLILGQLEVFS